jgi:hypothetical protein
MCVGDRTGDAAQAHRVSVARERDAGMPVGAAETKRVCGDALARTVGDALADDADHAIAGMATKPRHGRDDALRCRSGELDEIGVDDRRIDRQKAQHRRAAALRRAEHCLHILASADDEHRLRRSLGEERLACALSAGVRGDGHDHDIGRHRAARARPCSRCVERPAHRGADGCDRRRFRRSDKQGDARSLTNSLGPIAREGRRGSDPRTGRHE